MGEGSGSSLFHILEGVALPIEARSRWGEPQQSHTTSPSEHSFTVSLNKGCPTFHPAASCVFLLSQLQQFWGHSANWINTLIWLKNSQWLDSLKSGLTQLVVLWLEEKGSCAWLPFWWKLNPWTRSPHLQRHSLRCLKWEIEVIR